VETLTAGIDRALLIAWYHANRARSAAIFDSVTREAYYDAPIPLRHPFVFYDGHLPAFSAIVLHRRALGGAAIDEDLETLFQRGIDPADVDSAGALRRTDWPAADAVRRFAQACDDAVLADLAHARLDDASNPMLAGGEAVYNILEHEPMHHETLLYLVTRLPAHAKRGPVPAVHADVTPPRRDPVAIAAGRATLGARRDAGFGWDNEFDEHVVEVGAFGIDVHDVTNGDYLAFVRDGAAPPPFWIERDGALWLRTVYGEIPLPASWPVYVSHDEAAAFAAWSGARLPTEAEYHRAAFGAPDGTERAFPWGDAAPSSAHGNFDFRRYDPEPIGSSPAGASAWGVHDLIGNGWEWTATPFAPFDGFAPMPTYPVYSADFFDGKHYVMKGASPVTSHHLVRRSFRNWFYADYPYTFATFRRVYDR
jgi:formylglycine-generating enzyme required for sulfatase activity